MSENQGNKWEPKSALDSHDVERALRAPLVMLDCLPPHTPKMLIETLAVAQGRVGNSPLDPDRREEHVYRLQWLINNIEAQS